MKCFIIWALFATIIISTCICQTDSKSEKEQPLFPDYLDTDTDALLTWEAPKEFQKEFPYYLSGFDEDNAPIWISEFGKWDARKVVERGWEEERILRKYLHQFLRRVVESRSLRNSTENPVTEVNIIFDMDGYGSNQAASPPTVSLTLWFARQIEQAWRNKFKKGYLINTNYIFSTVWNLMKPLLGPTVYKVEVLGNNKDRWIPAIIKSFSKSEIPKWYGGSGDHKPIQVYG